MELALEIWGKKMYFSIHWYGNNWLVNLKKKKRKRNGFPGLYNTWKSILSGFRT
jgi:hypothetical protein